MVSISREDKNLSVEVSTEHKLCCMYCEDSGVGKSFYSRHICGIIEQDGLGFARVIDYKSVPILNMSIQNRVKHFLIVLDQLELYYDSINIDDVLSISDNVWIVGRWIENFVLSGRKDVGDIYYKYNNSKVTVIENGVCSF